MENYEDSLISQAQHTLVNTGRSLEQFFYETQNVASQTGKITIQLSI